MTDIPRWQRGQAILSSAVHDMERTRALKLDLEILPGVRRDDPAAEIIFAHARATSDELASLRNVRDELREANRTEDAELDTMMKRALNG